MKIGLQQKENIPIWAISKKTEVEAIKNIFLPKGIIKNI